jgi:hypothetical protein
VTASNAHVLLTKGKQQALNGLGTSKFTNYYAERGITLEPEAIELYERIYNCKVEIADFVTNSDYPDAGFSPDGLTDIPVQVKCYMHKKHLDLVETGFLDPLKYFETYCQVQFEMMIYEAPFDDLTLYNPEVESKVAFKVIRVPRDEKLIARFKEKLYG